MAHTKRELLRSDQRLVETLLFRSRTTVVSIMRVTAAFIILLVGALATHYARAEPNRDSLVEAWEAHIAARPSTVIFESVGDGVYRLEDSDLPYEGELKVVGALVRSADTAGYDTGFNYLGMVDFQLSDMPADRMSSQVYYYWLSDRQTLHYSEAEQRWVDTADYQASISDIYSSGSSFGALSFMLNYGIWVIIIGLLVFTFVAIGRQAKKARSLMDETAAINQKARENIERAEGLQDEVLAIARESRDLQSENNALLRQLLDTLRK